MQGVDHDIPLFPLKNYAGNHQDGRPLFRNPSITEAAACLSIFRRPAWKIVHRDRFNRHHIGDVDADCCVVAGDRPSTSMNQYFQQSASVRFRTVDDTFAGRVPAATVQQGTGGVK